MLDEDEKLKDVEKDTLPKKSVRIVTPEVKPKTEIGNSAQKKKTNRNGKVGVTKRMRILVPLLLLGKFAIFVIQMDTLRMHAKRLK